MAVRTVSISLLINHGHGPFSASAPCSGEDLAEVNVQSARLRFQRVKWTEDPGGRKSNAHFMQDAYELLSLIQRSDEAGRGSCFCLFNSADWLLFNLKT